MKNKAFVFWAALALLWANLPYLTGYVASTPQNRFGGFFIFEQDGYSYYAKMRQGAQGAWTFHLPYTSEDEYQSGGIALMFYIVVGKLMLLGFSDQFLYHAARLLSSILLLIVLARFVARFISDRRWRLWTWWLLLFSGGWGLLISYLIDPKYVAYELVAPDGFIFSILYGPPHVILGFALLLIWIGYALDLLKADRSQLPKQIIIANILGALTALSREAYGPVFAGVFAAYWLAHSIQQRKILWLEGMLIVSSAITAGLYGVYMLIAYRTIPGFVVWYAQNPFGSPSLIDFLLGFAPLLIVGIIGLIITRRASSLITNYSLLVTSWLIAGPIMAYLPISIGRRLIAGWQIPVCIFGAYALMKLWQSKKLVTSILIVAVVPTTLLLIVGSSAVVAAKPPTLFQSSDELAALDWLSHHTTDRDVVLSDWRFGNLVPVYADARVFIGHPIETAFFKDKQAGEEQFFSPTTANADRIEFIKRWHITIITIGLQQFDPQIGILALRAGPFAIYRLGQYDQ